MKKILFVINTMGCGGAEIALLELLNRLSGCEDEIFLYVIMGQGELIDSVPSNVRVLNSKYDKNSVLNGMGRRRMIGKVCRAFFRNGNIFSKIRFITTNMKVMIKERNVQEDKLLWRVMSEGAVRFDIAFDLAVAWLEGASAYYVAEHVNACRKAAFIHIDYESAGYTRTMDQACFAAIDTIFAVSDEVREHFLAFYPEYESKTKVFRNMIDQDKIRRLATERGGFEDNYEGIRLLSVGRLSRQKAYDLAIEAMRILKEAGYRVRWYVLGEGKERRALEKQIASLALEEDFRLLGMAENPYPFYRQTDIYVHATRYEGKSVAIQEAQILGCAIIASDCNGNREQIVDGYDGILCSLTSESIAESIARLYHNKEERKRLGEAAKRKGGSDMLKPEEIIKNLSGTEIVEK